MTHPAALASPVVRPANLVLVALDLVRFVEHAVRSIHVPLRALLRYGFARLLCLRRSWLRRTLPDRCCAAWCIIVGAPGHERCDHTHTAYDRCAHRVVPTQRPRRYLIPRAAGQSASDDPLPRLRRLGKTTLSANGGERNRGDRLVHRGREDGARKYQNCKGCSKSRDGQQGVQGSHVETHVFYAARCTDKNGRCSLPFLQRHICTVENLNGA